MRQNRDENTGELGVGHWRGACGNRVEDGGDVDRREPRPPRRPAEDGRLVWLDAKMRFEEASVPHIDPGVGGQLAFGRASRVVAVREAAPLVSADEQGAELPCPAQAIGNRSEQVRFGARGPYRSAAYQGGAGKNVRRHSTRLGNAMRGRLEGHQRKIVECASHRPGWSPRRHPGLRGGR
jgi:hypothetical protein